MSADGERVRLLITQQAADWFIANRAGLSRGDTDAFAAWLRASPVHVEEYLSIAAVVRDLRAACSDSADSIDELVVRARREQDAPVQALWPRDMARHPATARLQWKVVALVLAVMGCCRSVWPCGACGRFRRDRHRTPRQSCTSLHAMVSSRSIPYKITQCCT